MHLVRLEILNKMMLMIFLRDEKKISEILPLLCLLSKFSQLVIIQLWEKISAREKNNSRGVVSNFETKKMHFV